MGPFIGIPPRDSAILYSPTGGNRQQRPRRGGVHGAALGVAARPLRAPAIFFLLFSNLPGSGGFQNANLADIRTCSPPPPHCTDCCSAGPFLAAMVQGSAMVSGWDRAVLADCVSCCFHCPIFVANSSFDKSLEENLYFWKNFKNS